MYVPELQDKATALVQKISEHIFTVETRRTVSKDTVSWRYPSPLFACYLDALPHGLARESASESDWLRVSGESAPLCVCDNLHPVGHTRAGRDTVPDAACEHGRRRNNFA